MSGYKHTRGIIRDNAIEALLHDPLYRQRIVQQRKGKGSFKRKEKSNKENIWEGSDKSKIYHCPSLNYKKAASLAAYFRFLYFAV